jgi:CPA2 family monovalent cation:H+ antiporter-2
MSEIHFLGEFLVVLLAVISILFVFQKLKLPTIVGFLLAGVIMGPTGLGLLRNLNEIEVVAEVGVALLLFTIGLEFSLEEILTAPRRLILAGALQVVLTSLVVFALFLFLGQTVAPGVFYGFLLCLSSTAIVLRIYSERNEINAPQGRLATGVLLFQDLCIVPMMLLVPILGRSGQGSLLLVGWAMVQSIVALLLIVFAARKVLPWLLRQIALLRNREVFTLFIVFVCLGTAWMTSRAGLSLALGALIAGLVISESELSHQAVADILPLRDCFSGIFFISVGMLLNLDFLIQNLALAALNLILVIGIKGLIIFLVFWGLYGSLRLGVVLAMGLSQVGEFSFILAKAGIPYGLLTPFGEQTFLAASILTMIATPFLIQWAHRFAFGLESAVVGSKVFAISDKAEDGHGAIGGHVIIVGFGLNGQNLSRVLKEVGIPYRALDMDPDLARDAQARGEPVLFGDGTRLDVLQRLGISRARVLVVAISAPIATARVVWQARRLRPDLFIIVRTRYVAEIDRLYRLGANQVIPEEFETSVEIFARVLQEYHVPRNVIGLQVDLIRKEHYGTLRGLRLQGKQLDQLSQFLAGTTTDIVSILERSPAVGKSLRDIDLRARSGCTLIAVVRDGHSHQHLNPDFVLVPGDLLVLLGSHKALDDAVQMLTPANESEPS